MNFRHKIYSHIAQGFLTLALWLGAHTASALVIVNLDVTPSGGNYHYEASIDNGEAVDLVLVSLFDAPLVTSLTAPPGFQLAYTAGPPGAIYFLPDLGSPSVFAAGTTTSGFSFDSAFGPAGFFTSAEAIDDSLTFYATQVKVRGVPDSGGTFLSLALSLGTLVLGRKRMSASNL